MPPASWAVVLETFSTVRWKKEKKKGQKRPFWWDLGPIYTGPRPRGPNAGQ